eukprot:UN15240
MSTAIVWADADTTTAINEMKKNYLHLRRPVIIIAPLSCLCNSINVHQ